MKHIEELAENPASKTRIKLIESNNVSYINHMTKVNNYLVTIASDFVYPDKLISIDTTKSYTSVSSHNLDHVSHYLTQILYKYHTYASDAEIFDDFRKYAVMYKDQYSNNIIEDLIKNNKNVRKALELFNYHNDMEKKIKYIKTQYDEFIKGEKKLPFDCVEEILIWNYVYWTLRDNLDIVFM